MPGWMNIDLDAPEADLQLDLTELLPFESNSVKYIFSEHFIEHVTRDEAITCLQECRRVLADNGVARFTTPSLKFLAAAYLAENKSSWGNLWQPNSFCMMMNEGMRSWGHKFLYDAQEITDVLVAAGFNTITFENYRESLHKEFHGIESRPYHNELIVEATKDKNATPNINFKNIKSAERLWSKKLKSSIFVNLNFAEENLDTYDDIFYSTNQELIRRGQVIDTLERNADAQQQLLRRIGDDWEARGQFIKELEKSIAENLQKVRETEAERDECERHIGQLNDIISSIQAELADRESRIFKIEADKIELINQLQLTQAALSHFESSVYGRIVEKISRIHSNIRSK